MTSEIPFDRVGHFIRVRAGLLGGVEGRFLIDTGIGITVVHPTLVDTAGLERTDEHQLGHRMSGQEIRIPLVRLARLELGEHVVTDALAGVANLGDTESENGFDGIIGLDLLGHLPLTVDPFAHVIRLGAPAPGPAAATVVPARLNRDGLAVDMRVDLRLPNGQVVEVEVDTGSGSTILDTRFMAACDVASDGATARTEEGTDETGHRFVRRFMPIAGALTLVSAPETTQLGPTVMF